MHGLTLNHIYKSFSTSGAPSLPGSATPALKDVSFKAPAGQITAVVGPSGCGKSTLLNIIAGLETPDQGEVLWDGQSLIDVPAYRRQFGLMFQDFALFPHKNVFENIAFGLKMASHLPGQIQERVDEVLELVGLPGFAGRDINRLSGGEQQRVALARALAPRPRLLMLDEPLGSLDRLLRERLVDDLHRILETSQQTAIYVTHDQEEAFVLADQVVVMNAGQVEQIGAPGQIYYQPASLFVAQFLGMSNLLPVMVDTRPDSSTYSITSALGDWQLAGFEAPLKPGPATLLIRPETSGRSAEQAIRLEGVIKQLTFRGRAYRIILETHGVDLVFDLSSTDRLPAEGETFTIQLDPARDILVYQ